MSIKAREELYYSFFYIIWHKMAVHVLSVSYTGWLIIKNPLSTKSDHFVRISKRHDKLK